MMKDLNQIYRAHDSAKSFNNFFKTAYYKAVYDHLLDKGLAPQTILTRTRPSRGNAAQVLAHPMICMAFLHWLDIGVYVKALGSLMQPTIDAALPEDAEAEAYVAEE